MRHLVSTAVNPLLSLAYGLAHWSELSLSLRENVRKLGSQVVNIKTKAKYSLS